VDVAIGTPATIPGASGDVIISWAQRADEGPFSSLGIIDRMAYPNHEPLVTLAVLAGATDRIGLMPTVMVAPIRNGGLLAKQAASLDSLSGGRLTLALGIGGREEDYLAATSSTPFSRRATVFEEQLDLMRRVWRGEAPADGIDPIGPPPVTEGGPAVLIGGYSEPAARRAGRMGDGFIAGTLDPDRARTFYDQTVEEWEASGRDGRPRFVGCAYWALGEGTTLGSGRDYLRHYYGFRPGAADTAAEGMLDSAEAIRGRLAQAEDVGMDEYVLWPSVADIAQFDRLADVIA
jgi:alkanesulfonate monooxygenase SsuD/methylene tetrahydromethanopterin reductase-like flavin-dependent oxidoreductase (luciferase family)